MQNRGFPYRVGGAPGVGGHKRGKNSQFFSGDRPYIIGTGRDGTGLKVWIYKQSDVL